MTYSELKIELCKDNVPSHCIKITQKIFFSWQHARFNQLATMDTAFDRFDSARLLGI